MGRAYSLRGSLLSRRSAEMPAKEGIEFSVDGNRLGFVHQKASLHVVRLIGVVYAVACVS